VLYVVSGTVAYGWLVVPDPPHFYSGGASGAIFGVLGALVAHAVLTAARTRRERWIRAGIITFTLLMLPLNVPSVLVVASRFVGVRSVRNDWLMTPMIHGGGFVAGLIFGWVRRRGFVLRQLRLQVASIAPP
jgi:membrane associated rhomboid family serine protease